MPMLIDAGKGLLIDAGMCRMPRVNQDEKARQSVRLTTTCSRVACHCGSSGRGGTLTFFGVAIVAGRPFPCCLRSRAVRRR